MQLVHSKIIGNGKPLIILHGLLGMGDNWISLGRKYSEQGFEVHLIDQRNHGRSFHDDEMNYQELSVDLYNYINHYNLKDICLLGHSMGGKTAMFFAVTYPEKVEKLIVVDISPKSYPPHHNFIFDAIKSLDLSVVERKSIEKLLNNKINNKSISLFILKNLKRNKNGNFDWKPNIEILQNSLEELGEALPIYTTFNKPVLFIKGEKSPYINSDDYKLIKAHFPQSNIIEIENAGHWVHSEQAEIFYDITIDFIKS